MGFRVSLSFSDFVCLVDVDIETLNSVHLILKPQTLACRLSQVFYNRISQIWPGERENLNQMVTVSW